MSEPTQGLDLEAYAEAGIAALPQALTGYSSLGERNVELEGQPARLISSTYEDGGYELRNVQLLAVDGDTAYIVSATALAQDWDDYAELLEASLLSLTTE